MLSTRPGSDPEYAWSGTAVTAGRLCRMTAASVTDPDPSDLLAFFAWAGRSEAGSDQMICVASEPGAVVLRPTGMRRWRLLAARGIGPVAGGLCAASMVLLGCAPGNEAPHPPPPNIDVSLS